MSSTPQHYQAIILGSGQAGDPLANELARSGRRTVLVERERMGGTCINTGCTPTKTMVACARIAYLARRAADYGVKTGRVTVDMVKVRRRKRKMVELFGGARPDQAKRRRNLSTVFGEARFIAPRTIEVSLARGGVRRLSAEWVFINTGARPARPAIPGLDRVAALDSTSIMELGRLPEHLLVLGGGYIGLEFGQMFRRFGSRVTIVQRGKALLCREDPDVAAAVAEILRQDGVDVLLATEARSVRQSRNGRIQLTVRTRRNERTLAGSHLLVATGRVPNTDRLDLAATGVAMDTQGFIQVNERLETTAPGVWAVGDVKGGPAFTHISYDDYRVISANLLHGGQATTAGRLVPYTVFIDPQLGRVGLSQTEAEARGRRIRVARMGMDSVARALEIDESRGFIKVVVDADTDQILGCAVLGVEGGEIMSMLELAMMGRLNAPALRDAIFAHPTLAEALNNLFDTDAS